MPILNEGRFGVGETPTTHIGGMEPRFHDNETVEGWSDDVELVCRNIEHNAVELSRIHKRYYLSLSHQQIYYRIPIIVFSSLNSIAAVGMVAFVSQNVVSSTNCIISLICGIISSVELYFQLTKRIETELLTYREYYLLSTRINSCLKLERQHRRETSGIDFLSEIQNKYNTLFEASNVLIDDYTDELQLRRIMYVGDSPTPPSRIRNPINNITIN